jgi:hypothetical protein
MKAVILAGGFGTRLSEATLMIPKWSTGIVFISGRFGAHAAWRRPACDQLLNS